MEERIAIVGIIIENMDQTGKVNAVLHEYANYIRGRMGIPQVEEGVNVISIIVRAPQDKISAMTGKLGGIDNITCKAVYSKVKCVK